MYTKWNKWLFTNYIHHIESHDHINWCWAELECEATVEGFGTPNPSRLVSSPNVKSVFKIFVLFYVLFVLCHSVYCVCKCVLYYCHWVATQLQLTDISYHKWRLQTHCLDSFLACCALQGMPSLSAHGWDLFKNWTRKNIKMKLLSLWLVPYITFSLLGYFQNVSSILVSHPLLQDTPIHL